MNRQIPISDAEWEIMKVLWQAPGLTANEVAERLSAQQWHPKTVRTMLDPLLKKEVLETTRWIGSTGTHRCSAGKNASATPALPLSKVFDGAFTPMVAHFVKSSPLSKKDRAELERILGNYNDKENK
jgi:BlaI family penicillinase repressor